MSLTRSINQVNRNGDSPLHLALQIYDDASLLTEFLERGAKLGAKNKEGKTPLRLAYELGEHRFYCVEQLLGKLIDSGSTYAANRTEMPTILEDIASMPELRDRTRFADRKKCILHLNYTSLYPVPEILAILATYFPVDSLPAYHALIVDRMKQYSLKNYKMRC